jgi:hypothetical protein
MQAALRRVVSDYRRGLLCFSPAEGETAAGCTAEEVRSTARRQPTGIANTLASCQRECGSRTGNKRKGAICNDQKKVRNVAPSICGLLDMPRKTAADLMAGFGEIGNLAESGKSQASHAADFIPL